MYVPLVERIEHTSGFSIEGNLPKKLNKMLKSMGLKHSLDGGDVFRQGSDVEIKVERVGDLFDRIFYGIKTPSASIMVFSGDYSQAKPYEEAIQNFLETNNILYSDN
jgi:hypothetical protein